MANTKSFFSPPLCGGCHKPSYSPPKKTFKTFNGRFCQDFFFAQMILKNTRKHIFDYFLVCMQISKIQNIENKPTKIRYFF